MTFERRSNDVRTWIERRSNNVGKSCERRSKVVRTTFQRRWNDVEAMFLTVTVANRDFQALLSPTAKRTRVFVDQRIPKRIASIMADLRFAFSFSICFRFRFCLSLFFCFRFVSFAPRGFPLGKLSFLARKPGSSRKARFSGRETRFSGQKTLFSAQKTGFSGRSN